MSSQLIFKNVFQCFSYANNWQIQKSEKNTISKWNNAFRSCWIHLLNSSFFPKNNLIMIWWVTRSIRSTLDGIRIKEWIKSKQSPSDGNGLEILFSFDQFIHNDDDEDNLVEEFSFNRSSILLSKEKSRLTSFKSSYFVHFRLVFLILQTLFFVWCGRLSFAVRWEYKTILRWIVQIMVNQRDRDDPGNSWSLRLITVSASSMHVSYLLKTSKIPQNGIVHIITSAIFKRCLVRIWVKNTHFNNVLLSSFNTTRYYLFSQQDHRSK